MSILGGLPARRGSFNLLLFNALRFFHALRALKPNALTRSKAKSGLEATGGWKSVGSSPVRGTNPKPFLGLAALSKARLRRGEPAVPGRRRVRRVSWPRGPRNPELGVAHEAARVRVLVGRACSRLGDEDAAAAERDAARAVFAAPDLARLEGRPDGLTVRECEVLALAAARDGP
ncbi:hypothetical protein ACQPW3_26700 [Actinosynnema sp. CA-248983]